MREKNTPRKAAKKTDTDPNQLESPDLSAPADSTLSRGPISNKLVDASAIKSDQAEAEATPSVEDPNQLQAPDLSAPADSTLSRGPISNKLVDASAIKSDRGWKQKQLRLPLKIPINCRLQTYLPQQIQH